MALYKLINHTSLRDIIDFNSKTNEMEYIIPNNGNIITVITEEDFDNLYICLSPDDFEKYNGGICWDYVIYESNHFNRFFPNIRYDTFYVEMVDINGNRSTHTFLIFYMNKYVYWFESSWKKRCGIYKFNNINDCLSYVIRELTSSSQSMMNKYYCYKYDALDKEFIGLNCRDYMHYMISTYQQYKFHMKNTAKPIETMNHTVH